jgi:hypothetical protein
MRRSFAILVWILLGALAASLGIGSVLLNAKAERNGLEQKLQTEEARTTRLQEEHEQLIREANRTVAAAVRNASATRELLNAVTQEQAALEGATPLVNSASSKHWLQTISFPLGISIRTPPFVVTTSTDTLIQSNVSLQGGYPDAWLSMTHYDLTRFEDLTRNLAKSAPVNYRLNQTLITGIRGLGTDGAPVFVLRTQRRGVPIHLIWAKVTGNMTEDRILDSLSTLLFATN